jgi:RHS repeat-associated protein
VDRWPPGSGPLYFTVQTKDGQIQEFGNTADSRIEASATNATVRVWLLNKVKDASDNYMTVTYQEDTANGDYRPLQIDYTGNAPQSFSPQRSVKFFYSDRTDKAPLYVAGIATATTKLLTAIETWAPPPQGGAAVRVRQYQMTYAKGDNTYRNHLASMTECSATAPTTLTCLQPFTFTYQDAQTGFTTPFPTWPVTFPIQNANLQVVGDFNGDGKSDILAWKDSTHVRMFLSTGSGFAEQTWNAALNSGWNYVGDFNGDGIADLIVKSTSTACILYTSTGTGFNSSTVPCKINTSNNRLNFVGDFDGDGRDDIAAIGRTGATVWMNLSTDTGFTSQAWGGCGDTTNPGNNFVGDFNGDGLADLATNTCISLSNGSNLVFANGYTIPSPGFATNGHLYIGDFNGDGKTDFLSEDINNPGLAILYLSTGTRFVKATGPVAPMSGTVNFVGDFNGDGRTDFITAGPANGVNGHCQIAFSTGDGFHGVPIGNGGQTFPNFDCWVSDPANGTNFLGDFNGDGRIDIYNEAATQHMNLALDAVPDVITSMNNNIGGKIDIVYKPITDTTVYTKDTGTNAATFPVMDVQAHIFKVPIYMVSSNTNKTRADGTGQNFNYTYTYQGLKFHRQGRAGLGYRIMRTTDQTAVVNPNNASSKKQIINYFNQTFPFTGLLARIDSIDTQSPTLLFNQTLNTYEDLDTHPGLTLPSGDKRTRFPRLKQTDKLECDQQPTCFQVEDVFTHDINGNLTQTQHLGDVSITGDERTEVTDFISDTTNWLFKPRHTVLKNDLGQTVREKWLYYDDQNLPGQFGNFGTPARGRLTMEENRLIAVSGGDDHGNSGNAFTTYTNDAFGNRITIKNPIDCTTTTAYDTLTHTFPITITNCLGHVTKNTSDPRFGVKLSETDPNDSVSNPVVTTFEYDTFGRPTKKTGPLDGSSQFGAMSYLYNNFGNPTTQHIQTLTTKDHGTATVIAREDYFDGLGRFYKNESDAPAGKTIIEKFTYDSRNLLTERVAHQFTDDPVALPPTKYFYDVLSRLILLTRPDDTPSNPRRVVTEFFPREMQITDENGHQQVKFFDAYQQLEQVDEMKIVLGVPQVYATTLYDYDAAGSLIHVENDQHHHTRVKFDFLGRKIVLCDPNLGAGPNPSVNPPSDTTPGCEITTPGAWLYTYDKAGNLTSQKDAVLRSLGQQLTFQNDQLGRLTIKTYPNSSTITYTYDQGVNGIGRVSQVADLGGVVTSYTYDKMGRTIQTDRTIDGVLHTLTQTYNAMSQVLSETNIDNQQTGETIDYAYDEAGRLSSVLNYISAIKYNARGQKTEIDYFNNVISTFTYFDQVVAGQKINFRVKNHTTDGPNPNSPHLQNLDYTYDKIGNMTSIIDHVNSATRDIIEYDDQNRMSRVHGNFGGTNQALTDCPYDYDTIGNITNKCGTTYTYGDSNHPSFATATSDGKAYSADPNGNTLTSTDRSFTWTSDNRAASITFNGSTSTMDYDSNGARLKKFGPLGLSVFPFANYEIDGSGTKIKYVLLGTELLAAKKSSSEKMFYHNDHLTGVNVITDMNAAQSELMEYDPWGKLSRYESTGNGIDTLHGYTGQELDQETDLYYYGGRYYDPQLARFVQPDPFSVKPSQPQELNRYSYANNNPYRYIDPTGYDDDDSDEESDDTDQDPDPDPPPDPDARTDPPSFWDNIVGFYANLFETVTTSNAVYAVAVDPFGNAKSSGLVLAVTPFDHPVPGAYYAYTSYTLNFSPPSQPLIGVTYTFSKDYLGRTYSSVYFSIGKSPTTVSWSITNGYLNVPPTPDLVSNFMTGWSQNLTACCFSSNGLYGVSYGVTTSSSVPGVYATEVGIGSLQYGVSGGYGWEK